MFNTADILANFLGQIGLDQTVKPCYPLLNSGLVKEIDMRGIGNFLSPEFIYETVDGFELANNKAVFSNYNALTSYNAGDRVLFTIGTQIYVFVSRQNANLGNTPAFESLFWESDLSFYVRKNIEKSTLKVCQDLLLQTMNENKLQSSLDFGTFYEQSNYRHQNFNSLEFDGVNDYFIGNEILLNGDRDAVLKLTKIGLYFETAQTLNFYLYNASQKNTPILTIPITIDLADEGRFVWKDINLNLFRNDKNLYPKTSYHLGFWLSDLVGKAHGIYAKQKTISYHPNFSQISYQKNFTKPNFLFNTPFSVSFLGTEYVNYQYVLENDFTQSLISLGGAFLDLIKHDFAIRILQEEFMSGRKNQSNDHAKRNIPTLLYGEQATFGLIQNYENRIKRCKLNLSYKGSNAIFSPKFL